MDKEEEIADLKKQLQQTKDSLEIFAYSVSHDMREPVRMVKSFMDLLLRKYGESLDEKAKSYIGFACEGAGRADLMIQDLLFYYRSIRNRQSLAADLNVAYEGAIAKLKEKLESRQAKISGPALPVVLGDVDGFQEVFTYLIEHLLLQVPLHHQPCLALGANLVGRNWEITCSANSPDPEPGELRDLFRLFHNRAQQISAESTLNKLAVAKRIIEHLNGELKAGQVAGGGIVFSITIPSVHG
jgi:light-regulated signal transduction histidine kinase (bacteriophytochrome)